MIHDERELPKLKHWIQQLALDVVALKGVVKCRTTADGRPQHVMYYEDRETGMTICVTTISVPYLQIEIPGEGHERRIVFEVNCVSTPGAPGKPHFEVATFEKGPWVERMNYFMTFVK